jgi:hypothetical protein
MTAGPLECVCLHTLGRDWRDEADEQPLRLDHRSECALDQGPSPPFAPLALASSRPPQPNQSSSNIRGGCIRKPTLLPMDRSATLQRLAWRRTGRLTGPASRAGQTVRCEKPVRSHGASLDIRDPLVGD